MSVMPERIFRYDEPKYYGFGLWLGVANVLRNGFRLGAKKTLGKILQPINSYTRFPEYHFLEKGIREHLQGLVRAERTKILDVGSPKCFGLYLASQLDAEIHLTDMYVPDLEEAKLLWTGLRYHGKGNAVFSVEDARALRYPAEQFDVVYSMSVVEHVEGERGDSESIQEMMRVLKPGGLLLVTIPCGQKYVEQNRIESRKAGQGTWHGDRRFFQRIYTQATAEERILGAVRKAAFRNAVTVLRKAGVALRMYRRVGIGVRGFLGCLNPILSAALNDSQEGLFSAPSQYSDLHSKSDIYGDLVLMWKKETLASCGQTAISQVNPDMTA
jgi:SAM-dependent methyltransferase